MVFVSEVEPTRYRVVVLTSWDRACRIQLGKLHDFSRFELVSRQQGTRSEPGRSDNAASLRDSF